MLAYSIAIWLETAAAVLGDGIGLHHFQPADRGNFVEAGLSHLGTADRRAGTIVLIPNLGTHRTTLPLRRALVRHLSLICAD